MKGKPKKFPLKLILLAACAITWFCVTLIYSTPTASSVKAPYANPHAGSALQSVQRVTFPLISIIACFKGFDTYAAEGQRRALRSWMAYRPYIEIIMLCDDPGVAQVAKENGIKHVPGVEVTRHGIPYWKSVVLLGQHHASAPFVMFVNGDVVLRGSLMEPVIALTSRGITDFVLSGRRYDVNASAYSDHHLPVGWETSDAPVEELQRALDPTHGNFGEAMRMDYFVFPRGKLKEETTPNFQIGMLKWDGWLWDQWEEDARYDITSTILAVHFAHNNAVVYRAHDDPSADPVIQEGVKHNMALETQHRRYFTSSSSSAAWVSQFCDRGEAPLRCVEFVRNPNRNAS